MLYEKERGILCNIAPENAAGMSVCIVSTQMQRQRSLASGLATYTYEQNHDNSLSQNTTGFPYSTKHPIKCE
jgi:hypothetical protein